MNKVHTEELVNPIKNMDAIVKVTEQALGACISESTTEIAKQGQAIRRRPLVSPAQNFDGDSLIGDPSSLSLHNEQAAPRLPDVAQENSVPIDLVEAEAATVVTENTANTVINDEVRAHATTDANTHFVQEDDIDEIDRSLYATQPVNAQPPTAPPADMPTKKKRNRLSKDMRETIIQSRLAGHSALRIALCYGLATAQVERVLYQYVVALGHSLPPTKYSISKGGSPIKNAELFDISKNDYVRIDESDNGGITLERFQLDQESDSSAAPAQPKRKPTKAEQEVLDEQILHLIEEGHPGQAIALMCEVTENFVWKAIFRIFPKLPPTYNGQKYAVIKGGCPFMKIKALGITKDDYVRIERNEAHKLVITKLDVSALQDLSI